MLISDWSSDVCSSDLLTGKPFEAALKHFRETHPVFKGIRRVRVREPLNVIPIRDKAGRAYKAYKGDANARFDVWRLPSGKWTADIVSMRSEEHTSELQSLMRISYAVFCLKKKKKNTTVTQIRRKENTSQERSNTTTKVDMKIMV